MAIHIRDRETDRVVRRLAATTGTSITEAIRSACDSALRSALNGMSKAERLARMQAIVEELNRTHPVDPTVVIDKAFYDSLNDE